MSLFFALTHRLSCRQQDYYNKPMSEVYRGVKFEYQLERRLVTDRSLSRLVKLGKMVKTLTWSLYQKSARSASVDCSGNVSCRCPGGFIISATGQPIDALDQAHITLVKGLTKNRRALNCRGLHPPSSESLLHYLIYQQRPDVRAIIHCHDKIIVEQVDVLGVPTTPRECPYGTWRLAKAAVRILGSNNTVVLRNHGIFCVGSSLTAVWRELQRIHYQAIRQKRLTG